MRFLHPMSREEVLGKLTYKYAEEELRKMSNDELRMFFNINFSDVRISEVYND